MVHYFYMPEEKKYSLKKIIIFGVIVLILAGLVGFYFINKKNSGNNPAGPDKDLFPFKDGTTQADTAVTIGGNVTDEGVPQISDGTPISTTDGQRLRQITTYPVTDFFTSIATRRTLEPKLDEVTQQTKLVASTTPIDMLRWNIKQTGLLMDAEVSPDAIITTQKTQTKVPNAEELWFGQGGNSATYRTWNSEARTIGTLTGIIPTPVVLDYCMMPFTQNLKVGSKGIEVTELQKYINRRLAMNIAVDGSLGPKTFALVKNIQTLLNIPTTGVYDQVTKDSLNTDCTKTTADFAKQKNAVVTLNTTLLPQNILRGAASPDGTQLFSLIPITSGFGVSGLVSNPDGTGQRKIFESPATEWSAQWVNKNTIALTTLASREADGYLYFLNPVTGDFKKVLGPLRGLTTLVSPDGKKVLYSNSNDRVFTTKVYSTDTGALRSLDLATLPAKCTWQDSAVIICGVPKNITSGQYPDAWYQGTVSFSDVVWLINTVQNSTNIVLAPDESFDVIKPRVSPNNAYLYFINKTDQTLWSYRLQ